jgi:hypothetical protein
VRSSASLPGTSGPGVPPLGFDAENPVTVANILDHIRCEIRTAFDRKENRDFHEWTAKGTLFLQVDDGGGVSPALSYIGPVSYVIGATPGISVSRQRLYSQTFSMDVDKLSGAGCPRLTVIATSSAILTIC